MRHRELVEAGRVPLVGEIDLGLLDLAAPLAQRLAHCFDYLQRLLRVRVVDEQNLGSGRVHGRSSCLFELSDDAYSESVPRIDVLESPWVPDVEAEGRDLKLIGRRVGNAAVVVLSVPLAVGPGYGCAA